MTHQSGERVQAGEAFYLFLPSQRFLFSVVFAEPIWSSASRDTHGLSDIDDVSLPLATD
jgi:hypothetical protein